MELNQQTILFKPRIKGQPVFSAGAAEIEEIAYQRQSLGTGRQGKPLRTGIIPNAPQP